MKRSGEGSLRVLICDDHDIIREAIAALLARQGFDVVGRAKSGKEAIRMVRDLRPAVALVDISMPDMDGIETTRRLVGAVAGVRVIGLSLRDDPETMVRMKSAGAVAHVSKAAPAAELAKAIRRAAEVP